MLDVHAPHKSIHTWKDFCVHSATITVGLLIAIGLEQMVEAIHHRHQRDFLEEQMFHEAEENLRIIKPQLEYAQQQMDYLLACERALQNAPADGTGVKVTLPVQPPSNLTGGILISPARGTWTVAKAAGSIALLPPELAKVYARVDLAAEFEKAAEDDLTRKEMQLSTGFVKAHVRPGTVDAISLTAGERDELLVAFHEFYESVELFKFRLAILSGACDAVVARAQTLQEMYPFQEQSVKKLTTPPP
jgi:hypothetical protein